MSTIYDVANVKGFIRMCNDGWLQGWHERNGGNLTLRLDDADIAPYKDNFHAQPRYIPPANPCLYWQIHRLLSPAPANSSVTSSLILQLT